MLSRVFVPHCIISSTPLLLSPFTECAHYTMYPLLVSKLSLLLEVPLKIGHISGDSGNNFGCLFVIIDLYCEWIVAVFFSLFRVHV